MIVLETERLFVREWVPDDWVRFKPLVVDPQIIQYINQGGPWPDERIEKRVGEYIAFGQTRGWHLWPVIHRADAKLIGFCGFSDGFPPDVEIGWRLLPEYWGQGLATEAAKATLGHGFKTWNFPRIIAVAQTPNRASIRVMEKIGMSFDSTFDDRGVEVVRYVVENPRHVSIADDSLTCRQASTNDVALLASMNQHLIADEASRNPMSLAELDSRMKNWLDGDWQAIVVELDEEPVGYMLFEFRNDEYRPSDKTVYVRQFFIAREHRCRGIGRRAFDLVTRMCFPDAASINLDVLATNPRARHFWASLGFRPYCATLRLSPEPAGCS